VKPEETEATIRKAVQDAVRDLPRVLINTTSGRLLDKSKQASMFESSPVFTELVSSMTTYIDTTRIDHEVAQYYRYATFSHKWEENEPLFEKVVHIVVYDLKNPSLMTNSKCSARSFGMPDSIGHGATTVALTNKIMLCSKRPWWPCSSGTRVLP
jgi:hypothetical protein